MSARGDIEQRTHGRARIDIDARQRERGETSTFARADLHRTWQASPGVLYFVWKL